MKNKIFSTSLIVILSIVGFYSAFNERSIVYSQSDYNLVQDSLEKDVQEVKKDKFEMITGKIKKITVRDGKRSLLIEDKKGIEYIFHISEHTIILTFEKLKVGQEVDIIFNGILTTSIPPQGTAIIVNGLKV
ncbi:DUF3221 domain-containing protein [Anaeromicrobium sediminis]|uniref:DUF3221 domain-containing protein n=1 Tax=Anaeromicrobium sediminis TaxID=1478221 RepID=A0A267MJL6_9FIRM|nr:DUF3221 domain-containing protein [Anaeromicrobium sediminis]PAB59612.1 hypothetical protein CCE28_08565 [Anaeromicrobium sediminis]